MRVLKVMWVPPRSHKAGLPISESTLFPLHQATGSLAEGETRRPLHFSWSLWPLKGSGTIS